MNNPDYGYIVAAGAASCLLANRLSANPDNQVLLREAGPVGNSPRVSVPIGFGILYHHNSKLMAKRSCEFSAPQSCPLFTSSNTCAAVAMISA